MQLIITHRTIYAYDPAPSRVALKLRIYPSNFEGQRTLNWSVKVNDRIVEPLFTDGFGDQTALWFQHSKCDIADIVATGTVETDDKAGLIRGLPALAPSPIFLRSTELTEPDERIKELASGISGENELERMHALSQTVADALKYQSGTTHEKTTAAQALESGEGVCQDFAHILIAAARSRGVPARYVSGYLLTEKDEPELHETHAWAEIYIDGLGWVGFDPANGVCPTDHYVRIASGFDADQAAPIKGSITGEAAVTLSADVQISQQQQ